MPIAAVNLKSCYTYTIMVLEIASIMITNLFIYLLFKK